MVRHDCKRSHTDVPSHRLHLAPTSSGLNRSTPYFFVTTMTHVSYKSPCDSSQYFCFFFSLHSLSMTRSWVQRSLTTPSLLVSTLSVSANDLPCSESPLPSWYPFSSLFSLFSLFSGFRRYSSTLPRSVGTLGGCRTSFTSTLSRSLCLLPLPGLPRPESFLTTDEGFHPPPTKFVAHYTLSLVSTFQTLFPPRRFRLPSPFTPHVVCVSPGLLDINP